MSERLPELLHAGTLEFRDGVFIMDGWRWGEDRIPPGRYDDSGIVRMAGRSIRQLHEMAHGVRCHCPVHGAGFDTGHIVLGHDEEPPYAPEFWRQLRPI